MPLKLALPAGQLARPTDELLRQAGLIVRGYTDGSRSYRPTLDRHDDVLLRVFREKDIPIQIALGNYDLGICSLAWLEELLIRYPSDAVVQLRPLPLDRSGLYVAAACDGDVSSLDGLAGVPDLRLVSEYPILSDAFALSARLPAYRVFAVWGAAEAYPPEDADVAIIVDCADMGKEPGTVVAFSPHEVESTVRDTRVSLHSINLLGVVELAQALGYTAKIRIIGIQPQAVDFGEDLTEAVEAAVRPAAGLVVREIAATLEDAGHGSPPSITD